MIGPRAGASTVGMMRIVDALARSIGGKARNSMAVPDRREHPATDALEHAERDELGEAASPGRTAPTRA